MTFTLPTIEASRVLTETTQSFLQACVSDRQLIELVQTEVAAHLGPDANVFHAEVVGAMLAGSTGERKIEGLYGPRMLQVKWDAAYKEHPNAVHSLGIHGAYEFALCLGSLYRSDASKRSMAITLLESLQQQYPLPGAGVFDAADID